MITKSLFFSTLILISNLLFANTTTNPSVIHSLPGDVKYQYIGEYSKEKLSDILKVEIKNSFSDFAIDFSEPKNAVALYKVTYRTKIIEKNNLPVFVDGLIAVPIIESKTPFPILSYEHGTIFDKEQVPSQPDKSMETKIILAVFAGNGYIVICPDYVGVGSSNEPNAWLVKGTTAQTCFDMLTVSKAVLLDLKVKSGPLFISGWSQGSFSALAFLHLLEDKGIDVMAAGFASSPNDIYLAFNRWIFNPSKYDASYLIGTAAMLVLAYENYYGFNGLSKYAIKPQYLKTATDFYNFKISWTDIEKNNLFPKNVKDLFQENFLKDVSLASNPFAKQLQENNSYNWRFKTKTRFYYGKIDEVVTPFMVQLPVKYQETLGAELPMAIYAGDKANHRGTFLYGMKDQQEWFSSMRKENTVTQK